MASEILLRASDILVGWRSALLCALPVAVCLLYQWLLPKPIPGIPFNVGATRDLLGDVPDLVAEVPRTKDFNSWLKRQAENLNSPIVQVFMRPFARPFLILSDFRETQDILLHRKEDFDRTDTTYEMFGGLAPNFHLHMKTNAVWKAHRRLLQDLMVPGFLNTVAAPAIYASALRLIDLWEAKRRVADSRPFSAAEDIHYAALDAVLPFSFGSNFPHSAVGPQVELLRNAYGRTVQARSGNASSTEEPVRFLQADSHEAIRAMVGLTDAMAQAKSSIFPLLHWKVITSFPSLARATRVKNEFIMEEVRKAVDALSNRSDSDGSWVRSAVDHIVDRENKSAEKEKRKPSFFTDAMRDEVFGFVVAGHDTTSTTLSWCYLLADHPDAQSSLRSAFRSAYPNAMKEKRHPTLDEITHTQIP